MELQDTEIETTLMADNISGLVFHAVLNQFLEELKNIGEAIAAPINGGTEKEPLPTLPDSYRKQLTENMETVFATFPRFPHNEKTEMSMLTARLLHAEKSMFHAQLENLLVNFISYFAGFRVVASESNYRLQRETHCLNGIIDCILEDQRNSSGQCGTAVLIDFKTKYKLKLSDYIGENGLTDFQLPLYLRLAEAELKKDVHTALFFSILEAKPQVLFGFVKNIINDTAIPKKPEDCIMPGSDVFINIMNEFDKKTEQFTREISGGSFSFSPLIPKACMSCDYKKICRTLYQICRGNNDTE
jgi:ATP-dependent helicase/DNAse subunit B